MNKKKDAMWFMFSIYHRIDSTGKGPGTNSVNSNISDESAETKWILWIFKCKPSTLGIFCCNDRKTNILIVVEEEEKDLAAIFKTYNLLWIFLIFLAHQSMIHLGKIIPDLLVISCSNVRQLNQHYFWHIEALHAHLQGKFEYRLCCMDCCTV